MPGHKYNFDAEGYSRSQYEVSMGLRMDQLKQIEIKLLARAKELNAESARLLQMLVSTEHHIVTDPDRIKIINLAKKSETDLRKFLHEIQLYHIVFGLMLQADLLERGVKRSALVFSTIKKLFSLRDQSFTEYNDVLKLIQKLNELDTKSSDGKQWTRAYDDLQELYSYFQTILYDQLEVVRSATQLLIFVETLNQFKESGLDMSSVD
jgi:hypothetical protein